METIRRTMHFKIDAIGLVNIIKSFHKERKMKQLDDMRKCLNLDEESFEKIIRGELYIINKDDNLYIVDRDDRELKEMMKFHYKHVQDAGDKLEIIDLCVENQEKIRDGWISTEGHFYDCPNMKHRYVAKSLHDLGLLNKPFEIKTERSHIFMCDSEYMAEINGYIKIRGDEIIFIVDCIHKKQLDTIFDYMRFRGLKEILYKDKMMRFDEFIDLITSNGMLID